MTEIQILNLAYSRRDAGDNRDLSEIIAEIRADLATMQPPAPGGNDEIGYKSEVINGVRKDYKIMGDGSMVEIDNEP